MLCHTTLVQSAYYLQALPPSLARLTALMGDDPPDLDALVDIIAYDPIITARLLRVANSSFSAPGRAITRARDAVVRLGPGLVFSVAIGSCARPLMEQTVPGYGLPAGELWRHSVRAALAAEAAGRFCDTRLSPASFTAALLHDIGKLVLGRYLTPDRLVALRRAVEEGGLESYQAEAELLSLHHGEVGGVIAQHWQLPDSLVQGIIHHHDPQPEHDPIAYVTCLADRVAHALEREETDTDEEDERLTAVLDALGMTPDGFADLRSTVAENYDRLRERYG